ncbi:MAG: bifunctional nuclease family protein [Candidatus Hydrogenedens sp.]|nr:bifunctional nuclease family protein [Candidatus Hydrogenedens sp.]
MIELELLGVSQADENPNPLVLLRHESRVLPIVVGIHEASAIQVGLMGESLPRPMTHDLIKNLLVGLRAEVKSVVIYRLEHGTFFAHLNIEQRNAQGEVEQILKIDTRPSDGIAIAVRMGADIYASEEVMDEAAQEANILEAGEEPDDLEDDDLEDED